MLPESTNSPNKKIRCFIGIAVSSATPFATLQNDLLLCNKNPATRLRIVPASDLHITVKFLGAMFEDELPSLRSTLAAVCNNVAPFSLPIAGIGFFNNSVWAKVSSEAGLTGLATDINRACATLGYPVATKPFFPHLTLARLGRNSTLARTELSEKYGTNVWTTIAANSLNLYESITYADGASYNVIGCYPFSAETCSEVP